MPSSANLDVVIVGAGLTGLKAALDMQTAGFNVMVLEARSRVGGRACSVQQTWNGAPTTFDFGAHFIGDENYQKPVWDLAASLGITPFAQYDGPGGTPGPTDPVWFGHGANLQENISGTFDAYIGTTVPAEPTDQYYLGTMQALVDTIPISAPWSVPAAAGLDAQSVQDWIDNVNIPEVGPPSDYFKGLLTMLCRVGFSCEPRDISMLWLLFYVGSSGGLQRFQALSWPLQGAQGFRLPNGAQSLAEGIKAKLLPGTVVENFTVVSCNNAGPGVMVYDANGNAYTAKAALFAMSPLLYSSIKFTTQVPPARVTAAQAMKNSNMFMTFVRFDNAFWRNNTTTYTSGTFNGIPVSPNNPDPLFQGNIAAYGLSGDVLFLDGPSVWMMDNTSAEGAPALFAFIVGDEAVKARAMTPAQRGAMIIQRMTNVFGAAVQQNNPQYNEKDWNAEPFSMGCPAGHFGKGSFMDGGKAILLSSDGKLPVGTAFFASTETATLSNGYMSGAVWSGTQIATVIGDYLAGKPAVVEDDFVRKQGMLFAVNTIMGAIAAQNPMLEWPVIDKNIIFHGPGGATLGGNYPGYLGTIDFYTKLGLNFTITRMNVEAVVTDVPANRAYAYWNVSGVVNATGTPFRDVKGTMVFNFTPRGQSPILVAEDWLLMDCDLIDALANGLILPPTGAAAIFASAQAAQDLSWLTGQPLTPNFVAHGPGGAAVPSGPYYGVAGLNTLLAAFSALSQFQAKLIETSGDTDNLAGILQYQISGIGSNGQPFKQPLLITVRFGNHAGNDIREVWIQTDGSTL